MNELDWKLERERLAITLGEAQKQYAENCELNEKIEQQTLETQQELWESVGPISVSNGLHQLVDFLQFVDSIKRQKRSYGFAQKQKQKFAAILKNPYFGRVDFQENSEDGAQQYYIGTFSLITDDYQILIYDWRAPVSSMFYDYEIGHAKYDCPNGTVSGVITQKRQYKIADGEIVYMFDSNLKIDDEMLQQILGKSADSRMRNIVTSIQREQNRAIRNDDYKHLIVQGAAGSGKTSIALHRAAYLLYKYRDRITARNIVIFSPNSIFNDYIANVLPELGEDNILQTTFEEYMQSALRVQMHKESYYDMMEYIMTGESRPAYRQRCGSIRYKSCAAFRDALKRYIAALEEKGLAFSDIVFHDKVVVSGAQLKKLFYEDCASSPLQKKLAMVRTRIQFLLRKEEDARVMEVIRELQGHEKFRDAARLRQESLAIVKNELKDIRLKAEAMTAFDSILLYKRFIKEFDQFVSDNEQPHIQEIRRFTLENLECGQLYYEDQIALLYLQGALCGTAGASDIKFVIIDEQQDYSPLQFEIFNQLFPHASFTMLGDINQSINPFLHIGDYADISHIFPEENTLRLALTKSYRSTMEITEFSKRLLLNAAPGEAVGRHGEVPVMECFATKGQLLERILADVELYTQKGCRSIGLITRSKKEACEVHSAFANSHGIALILDGGEDYKNGVVLMPAYLAKGLEFDVVILIIAGEQEYAREEERKLLYTACTRALHVLRIYHCGRLTPLLSPKSDILA